MINWDLVFQGLAAIGTVAVAILAIWGEKIRACLAPPKLIIQPHTLRGDPTVLKLRGVIDPSGGQKVMYYHLKVMNVRPWLAVQNCRVLLKGLSRRGPDGRFRAVSMAVPVQFVWAPAEVTPQQITIAKEQVLDFGRIGEQDVKFTPILYTYPNNFQGFVEKDQAVRYYLEIEASNFVSPKPRVFEVAWDGKWEFEPEKMEHHLRITEIHES
ncbi:MAG TPA: hypothetical protein VMT94_03875 [Burkholderiales bacterium]|nr:hypothetical protein [Burkholderiales bacterium]